MTCLAPELVYLSFEMHEQALTILCTKLNKFMQVESLWRLEEEQDEAKDELKAADKRSGAKQSSRPSKPVKNKE